MEGKIAKYEKKGRSENASALQEKLNAALGDNEALREERQRNEELRASLPSAPTGAPPALAAAATVRPCAAPRSTRVRRPPRRRSRSGSGRSASRGP